MSERGRLFDGFLVLLSVAGLVVAVVAGFAILNRPAATASTAAESPGAAAEPAVVHVTLTEFAIQGDLVAPPGPVRLQIHNQGAVTHNLALVGGPVSEDLAGGETGTLDLGVLDEGTYQVECAIPGHREAGMTATLTVTADAAAAPEAAGHDHTGDDVDWAALDRAMTESMLAFPAETEGRGNQLLEPTVLADGTKRFELTAAITPWEVEPGKVVDAWTYNGMAPGPRMEVEVGDRVQVVVHNELPMGTDVHFHGVRLPNNMDGVAPLTQPLIMPGESFTYEFVAEEPAVAMYHAHHHGQMQVPNGLFGTFQIGDVPIPSGTIGGIEVPEGIEPALEIPMVLNDAGVIGFSLNGKSFPATEPYVVKQGDWLLVHYYNEGLQVHPMHQHQFPQLVIAKDGIPLDHPYWADTVTVAPGERYSVIFHADDPGVWVWHCHILNHVEREEGMFGMVTAVIVEP